MNNNWFNTVNTEQTMTMFVPVFMSYQVKWRYVMTTGPDLENHSKHSKCKGAGVENQYSTASYWRSALSLICHVVHFLLLCLCFLAFSVPGFYNLCIGSTLNTLDLYMKYTAGSPESYILCGLLMYRGNLMFHKCK